ncbi:AMP-binding protein [Pseudonocardia sp. NPDC049154]|uniref:class I adenylate-forming enzyme family protein n=1 Tax=Pseudonocardia sp. NPDC049154 TaxID=3155501 RepID=UPI0033C99CB1
MTTMHPRRLPDVLAVRAAHTPDVVAHDDTTTTLTFAEWDRRCSKVGGGLAAAGVAPGDRVLLPITNRHATGFAVAYLAAMRAGAIAVPLSPRLAPAEVEYFAGLVGAKWAITDVPERIAHVSVQRTWHVDDMPADLGALPEQSTLDPTADADIVSTSGTTGRPKGVVFSHEELVSRMGDGTGTARSGRLLHALPFSGFGGCHGLMLSTLQFGSTLVTQPAFDAHGFLDLVASREPDTLHLVPSMIRLILDLPDVAGHAMPSVRWIITGTAPVPHDSIERMTALWPHIRVINTYGMTEGSVGLSTQGTSARKPGCVGKPTVPGTVQIRDESGVVVPDGTPGEVWTKALSRRRYWNDPDTSASTWQDGWLRTGDLGLIDADGDVILTGRAKELIIRGGYNISPAEVEDVLHAHPAVREAAVIGVPHEVLGEDVAAAVVLRPAATADPAELVEWCRARLASNKVPRTVVVLDDMPYNQNAKVLKRELAPLLEAAAQQRRAQAAAS